jgi:hypothetical protein
MAGVIINGQAILHGIPNSGSAITISGYATFLLDKFELEHMMETYFTKDSQGNDASATAFNEHADITIDFTPSGASQAAVKVIPQFLTPLSAVTIANCEVTAGFESTSVAFLNSANWFYIGGARFTQTNTGAAKFTGMKLRLYANGTQAASMATTTS